MLVYGFINICLLMGCLWRHTQETISTVYLRAWHWGQSKNVKHSKEQGRCTTDLTSL